MSGLVYFSRIENVYEAKQLQANPSRSQFSTPVSRLDVVMMPRRVCRMSGKQSTSSEVCSRLPSWRRSILVVVEHLLFVPMSLKLSWNETVMEEYAT